MESVGALCETVLKGTLVARFYYIYAIDYDRGGEWSGQAFMCTRDKEFTIKGTQDCLARGFDRTGFFEVDTGEQRAWTVQLTDTAERPQQRPLTPGTPVLPTPGRQAPSQLPQDAVPMRRLRRTKIVATLGPASGNPDMIARLFEAGADVFRINMSHTPHDRMRELVGAIRKVEKDHNRPIGILVDLQGPKLRVGAFAGGSAMLDNGASFTFDADAKRRRRHARAPAASGNLRGRAGRAHAPARRRQDPPRRHRSEQAEDRHARRGRRQALATARA